MAVDVMLSITDWLLEGAIKGTHLSLSNKKWEEASFKSCD